MTAHHPNTSVEIQTAMNNEYTCMTASVTRNSGGEMG